MKQVIGILKLTSFMCDNKSTLIIYDNSGYVEYSLFGGHGTSGTPHALSNLDYRSNILPYEFLLNETNEQFTDRVAKLIIKNRLSKKCEIVQKRNKKAV